MPEVLFVCTGNYYRSRFAQAVFNYLAAERGLGWTAFSRGLAIHLVSEGDELSRYTREALQLRQIPEELAGERRVSLATVDLERADLTICLKRTEHLPLMMAQFPAWVDRVRFWEVHDLDFAQATEALPQIYAQVEALLEELVA